MEAVAIEISPAMMPGAKERSIKFVFGPPCSGKSYFIKRFFPEHFIVDLHDFQDGTIAAENAYQSYFLCRDAFVEAIRRHPRIVLKHTLLKRKRRIEMLEAVHDAIGASCKVDCWYSFPTLEEYAVYDKLDYEQWIKTHPDDFLATTHSKELLQDYLDAFELPTVEEGFATVQRIQDFVALPKEMIKTHE